MSYLGNVIANTGAFGDLNAVLGSQIVNIVQPGTTGNPALVLSGMGFSGGPSGTTTGACMFLNYNNPSFNVQWVMGDSSFIGTSAGMLRFISGGGALVGNTSIDSISGDGSTQFDVPFSSSPVPIADGSSDCGSATNRWANVYAINPVIQTSAANCKDNIQPSELGLNFINQLQPKSWNWKPLPIDSATEIFPRRIKNIDTTVIHHGFIFEDLMKIAPENFGGVHPANGKGTDGISYSSLIAPLVKAIQELSAEVKILKALVNA